MTTPNRTETRHAFRRISAHMNVPDEWIQERAEREGVPPALQPLITRPGGLAGANRQFEWRWEIVHDPTGRTRQVWFADGPIAGEYRMVPAERDTWVHPHVPPGHLDLVDGDSYGLPIDAFEYRIEERGGLWVGKWVGGRDTSLNEELDTFRRQP